MLLNFMVMLLEGIFLFTKKLDPSSLLSVQYHLSVQYCVCHNGGVYMCSFPSRYVETHAIDALA